jgi:cytochrome bd-type quinol oxidase subunit 2
LLVAPLLLALAGLVVFLFISTRSRQALRSETARRVGAEILRYVEVLGLVALVLALYMPSHHDRLMAVVLLCEGAFVSPLVLLIAYRLNRKSERYESLACRLRSYAVALPVPLLGAFFMPAL